MWFKLKTIGLNGKILKAIQSLYESVSCSVKVNNHLTDWFNVRNGLKQGCNLSPTLFSIYINDLVDEINLIDSDIMVDDVKVSILLYADDIILLASSEEKLQEMLNKLHSWCTKWRLSVNADKTKVLHFRNNPQTRSTFVFRCGESKVDYESSYKYLGFWFDEHLDLSKSVREITKSASRALGAVYTNYLNAGGMTYDVYNKLIESIVEPVLFYGSGIWGQRYFSEVDTVQNKACRYFLGTTKNASNVATKGDLGWTSCKIKQKIETVRLWCRIRNMDRDRLCRKVHEWSLTVHGSWEKTMIKFINDLNISDIMLCNNPHKIKCISKVKEKLLESEHSDWFSKLNKPGTEDNGNKLRTYKLYKRNLQTEYYVKCNMRKDQRRILAKFRSCNLPLAIETGRYTRPKTPVQNM